MKNFLTILAAIVGLVSAGCWLRAAFVKVTREQHFEREEKRAAKEGRPPELSAVVLNGWEMGATFGAQARWNSYGAMFAAISIILQVAATFAPE